MVKVKFFGVLKTILNEDEIEVDIDQTITVTDLIKRLINDNSDFEKIFKERSVVVAVNQEVASEETEINLNDEVAFLPPVSGG